MKPLEFHFSLMLTSVVVSWPLGIGPALSSSSILVRAEVQPLVWTHTTKHVIDMATSASLKRANGQALQLVLPFTSWLTFAKSLRSLSHCSFICAMGMEDHTCQSLVARVIFLKNRSCSLWGNNKALLYLSTFLSPHPERCNNPLIWLLFFLFCFCLWPNPKWAFLLA